MENGSSSSGPSVEVGLDYDDYDACWDGAILRTKAVLSPVLSLDPELMEVLLVFHQPKISCNTGGTGGPAPIGSVAGSGFTGYSFNTYGTVDDEWRRLLACLVDNLLQNITVGSYTSLFGQEH